MGDTQKKGGPEYAYRLRVSARRPDFELRVVPSTVSARPGSTIPVTVHALRRDGFDQDIKLSLKEPANGFAISGGWVPADQNKVQITLTVPAEAREEPYIVQLEGRADMRGRELVRPAMPAEDMMQAFIYHHLVPAERSGGVRHGQGAAQGDGGRRPRPEEPGEPAEDPRGRHGSLPVADSQPAERELTWAWN